MARQTAQARLEEQYGKPMAKLLPELFEQHGRQAAVAEHCGVTQGTVSLWMKQLGYQTWTVLRPIEGKAERLS